MLHNICIELGDAIPRQLDLCPEEESLAQIRPRTEITRILQMIAALPTIDDSRGAVIV